MRQKNIVATVNEEGIAINAKNDVGGGKIIQVVNKLAERGWVVNDAVPAHCSRCMRQNNVVAAVDKECVTVDIEANVRCGDIVSVVIEIADICRMVEDAIPVHMCG